MEVVFIVKVCHRKTTMARLTATTNKAIPLPEGKGMACSNVKLIWGLRLTALLPLIDLVPYW